MKRMKLLTALGLVLTFAVAGLAVAVEDVTLTGTVVCAKCSLKKDDAKECQDVLVTKDNAGASAEYYIVKNEVSSKFGHACSKQSAATVTGEVSEKDGRKWIAPSKMEKGS
jgi:type 1 fimbria pilin